MKALNIFILCAVLVNGITGCFAPNSKITVETTKQWENHYFTTENFYEGTKNIQLEKNETIWVLSSKTLNRLLQNINGK